VPRRCCEPPLIAGKQSEAADRALSADLVGVEQIQREAAPLRGCGRERSVERIGGIAHGGLPDADVAAGDVPPAVAKEEIVAQSATSRG
jgi:hypothetical protein